MHDGANGLARFAARNEGLGYTGPQMTHSRCVTLFVFFLVGLLHHGEAAPASKSRSKRPRPSPSASPGAATKGKAPATPPSPVSASPDPAKGPPTIYVPQWKKGQSWTIEVDAVDPITSNTEPWVTGRRPNAVPRDKWIFTVARAEDVKGLRMFLVQVRSPDPKATTTADLVFAGTPDGPDRMRSLFVLKGEYKYPTIAGVQTITKHYNRQSTGPFPVINEANGLMTDFPYLDSDQSVVGADGKLLDGVWKEYTASEVVGQDRIGRSTRQTIILKTEKIKFGEILKVKANPKANQDVYIRQIDSGSRAGSRLVFNRAFPWPVYGEGPRGRFWLLP